MIRLAVPFAALAIRLRRQAERIAMQRAVSDRSRDRGKGHAWRSAVRLWPDFTDPDQRS